MIESIIEPPSIEVQIGSKDLVQTIILDTTSTAPPSAQIIDNDEV